MKGSKMKSTTRSEARALAVRLGQLRYRIETLAAQWERDEDPGRRSRAADLRRALVRG